MSRDKNPKFSIYQEAYMTEDDLNHALYKASQNEGLVYHLKKELVRYHDEIEDETYDYENRLRIIGMINAVKKILKDLEKSPTKLEDKDKLN